MASLNTPCGIEIPQVFFDGPVDMEHIRRFVTRAERSDTTVFGSRSGFLAASSCSSP